MQEENALTVSRTVPVRVRPGDGSLVVFFLPGNSCNYFFTLTNDRESPLSSG